MAGQATERPQTRATFVALVLIFAAPVLAAWVLALYTGYMRDGGGTLQHGELIDPPRLLDDVPLTDPRGAARTVLHGKWTMLTIVEGSCEQQCRDNLYRMQQIRLAAGKDMQRIQRVVLVRSAAAQDSMNGILGDYPGQLILPENDVDADFMNVFLSYEQRYANAIFLIDPLGYLMMCYPADTDPSGIIQDMERLLRISRIG